RAPASARAGRARGARGAPARPGREGAPCRPRDPQRCVASSVGVDGERADEPAESGEGAVRPGASVRTARSRSRRSTARSRRRRTTRASSRRGSRRSRRAMVIAGSLVVGALGAFLIANSDRFQRALEEATLPLQHEDIIRQQAGEKGVPADLIAAVIYAESRFRDQTSHAGARGLMQITPSTAKTIERLSGGQTFKFDDLSNP